MTNEEQLNEWLDQCPIGYAQVDYEDDDIIGKNDSGDYTITDNTKGLPQFINPKEGI